MKLQLTNSSLVALKMTMILITASFTPLPAIELNTKQKLMKLAVCTGGAYGGFKLGQKLAEIEAKKLKLSKAEAEKHQRAITIGMAAAVCAGGYYLTGTVYEKLSKRDREYREQMMMAAVADSNSGPRPYVLPDSGLKGELTTDPPEQDGNRVCRTQVDILAKPDEPARVRWCKKEGKDKYELDF